MQNVVDGPGNVVSYRAEWVRLSGVAPTSSQVHEHRHICECLRLATSTDQVDISNLASFEQLVRRIIQLEMAVEKCPSRPDFTGLDVLVDGATSSGGAARAPRFAAWITEKQRERAAIYKQRRLYREELDAERSKDFDHPETPGGRPKAKGKGRNRNKDKDKEKGE